MKIYYRGGKKAKNIVELIKNGYTSHSFVQTYKDSACTEHQCHSAIRSFLDLYWMCKTYFPKTSKKEVAQAIFKVHKEIGLYVSYCQDIRKIVFSKSGTNYIELNYYSNQKGVGRYSFQDIKELANS